uniref:DUF4116 domain-containing protein n=2 Tax=unclassified Endozoicomonas TaxID=2644528 RepID=UPI00214751EB
EYETVVAQDGQQATLACARFNSKSGAFVVAGDITEKLASHRSLSSAVSDVPLAKAVPSWDDLSPSEDTFSKVASGFQWLTDQNARLLAFFASGGGLDCLANPIKLSMSPQRSKLLAETCDSVKRLVHGAEALLDGYHAFLRLAGSRASSEIEILLDELLQLSSRFETLKRTIRSGLKSIILPVQATEKGQLSPGIFRHWVADCHQLQSCLQALDPYEAEQIRSVHELIFALHQRFVKALSPVTVASGQGRISPEQCITYIDCRALTETEALLSPACKASLDALMILNGVVIIMDEALIVNLRLGSHVSVIELLEHAEGGKGRTLRLKYSDQFGSADDRITRGKFKRMWFLVESLKAIELDENADSIKLNCNAIAGEIIVECPRIRSRPIIREAFVKLTTVLRSLRNLDLFFSQRTIFEGGQWSFNSLVQRLNSGVSAEANRFAFQHCLFLMSVGERIRIDPGYYQLLSNRQRQFIDYGRRLATSEDNFCEMLMSDQHSKEIFRELYHHFLFLDPDKAYQWVELLYPHLKDQYYFIKPSYSYSLEFHLPPAQLSDGQKEKVKSFLLRAGMKYASQRIRNDKELVLAVISLDPSCLEGVSEELKNDKQVVLAAVTIDGDCLQEAGPEPRDNEEVVIAAIKDYPAALEYASDRIRNDKNIIKTLVAFNVSILSYVSKTLLKDRRCMLELIEINPEAFSYAAAGLKDNKAFINEAKQRNPEVRQYLR